MRTSFAAAAAALTLMTTAGGASASIVVAPFVGGDAAFLSLTNNGTLERAVAEGRMGDNILTGTWEMAIWQQGGVGVPKATDNLVNPNGTGVAFSVVWDGASTVTYTVGATSISWDAVAGGFTDIFIRVRSVATASLALTNMSLVGPDVNIPNLVVNGAGVDYLRISSSTNLPAFTLVGVQTLSWTGAAPTGSALAYQIKLTNVPAPAALPLAGAAGLLGLRRRRR
ncbi:MAG: hypothetical protein IBJ11_03385 [Phycisphaerales bacterium]|nr:hypothetical protein [Phycisphaerales bacterium]